MTDSGVPVRCPVCRREHLYAPPSYPCACGAPVVPPIARGATVAPVTDRSWADEWVTVRCRTCGRRDQWPQPELGCGCGAVLRIPVRAVQAPSEAPTTPAPPATPAAQVPPGAQVPPTEPAAPTAPAQPAAPAHIPLPRTAPTPRPAFQPVPVRTARDAVTVAGLYLRWLGYGEVRGAVRRAPSGVRVSARGVIALIEPSVQPTSLRDVECVWLSAMSDAVSCVCFSLAGYEGAARARADALSIPLFVIDLAGIPQPVNSAADELIASG
ncbi:hypothetical protein OG302_10400 [Streptomyces sp. NBC_01283]|uniref:hypothetical protein n=1 Tax=Streptomyces sp. NBC_01283 TaxID=2903812 RepID=UPI00352C21D4|nr:hypothetical protein OG302_10400 [Streptomyces sp. NBC_01283]